MSRKSATGKRRGRPPKKRPVVESNTLLMNEFPDVSNESTSFSIISESTNSLKRPLSDGVESERKKKFRLTDTSEDEFEVINKLDSGKNHTELLIQKVTESIENTIVIDKESNVSNGTHNLNNEANTSFNMVNHNGNNGIDDKDCKEDYPGKNIFLKDINKYRENKKSSINNVDNNCEFNGNNENVYIVKNGKNKSSENDIITSKSISCLNTSSSSSDNLVIIENSDQENENDAVDDFQVTVNSSIEVNDLTVAESNLNYSNTKLSEIENMVNSLQNGTNLLKNNVQHLTNNTDKSKTIESRPCNSNTNNTEVDVNINGIDQDFEVIDSDTNSDVSSSDLPKDINGILNGVHQMAKDTFPELLKLFSQKETTYEQFDSLCTQKLTEMMTERLYWGKERSELQLMKEREKHWRTKYLLLNRQFREIKTIVNVHKKELKTNEFAVPHLVTRTVGLQATLCDKRDASMKLPKVVISSSKSDKNPVNVISDDEDDVIAIDIIESDSIPTSNSENTTPKKQKPPLVTASKSPVMSPKTVTAAKSLTPTNIGTTTIDLTGNDDVIDESNIINLEEPIAPFKVLHRQSPAQLNNNLSKTITFVELPNLSTSSSSFILRKASASPQGTTVSNKDTINTSDPKTKNFKPYIIDVSSVDPVLVQPCTVTYTAQRVPVSQISGTLQPISSSTSYTPRQITVSQLSASLKTLTPTIYTTCQLPITRVTGSFSHTTPGTTFTACRLPISIHTIPPLASERGLMGCQATRPPPPAIPLLKHPAPLPGIPNQRSLISWKKIPCAPKVTLSKTVDIRIPQALVLSWNMTANKTAADVVSYQIFAYQELPNQIPETDLWKKIGDVLALPLPMACSLTQFSNGDKYHFAVRAVDMYNRVGPFSVPQSI